MAKRKKVDLVVVTCYGKSETMERSAAMAKYYEGIFGSEGSERDRYVNIYFQLARGMKEATDQL